MEATSPYLVVLEILIAVCGGILFFYNVAVKKTAISKLGWYIFAILAATLFWCFLTFDPESRWLGLKACLFMGCIYFASALPRQCTYLMIAVILISFSEGVWAGMLGTKYLVPPLILTTFGLFFIRKREPQGFYFLYLAALFELIYSSYVGARGVAVQAIFAIIFLYSIGASRLFLRYGQWLPFIYWLTLILIYFGLSLDINLVSTSGSNIERSSMILTAIENFFEYLSSGPKGDFDLLVQANMNILNLAPYESVKGIDPHSFLLSLWRDEGAVFSILWISVWFIYWKRIKVLLLFLSDKRVHIAIAILSTAIVQFSLSPPETATRLTVALILGLVLALANKLISTLHIKNFIECQNINRG